VCVWCVCVWCVYVCGVCVCGVVCVWCVCVYVGRGCFDSCMGVLVMCVLAFTVFCIVCSVFLYCFVYVHLLLFVLSVLV